MFYSLSSSILILVPPTPNNVEVTDIRNVQFSISWNSSAVDRTNETYFVVANPASKNVTALTANSTDNRVNITEAHPCTAYVVVVYAIDTQLETISRPSDGVALQTLASGELAHRIADKCTNPLPTHSVALRFGEFRRICVLLNI